jgi:hypothetical protein
MKGTIENFVQNMIVRFGETAVLRPRVHLVRITLPPAAGTNSDETPLDIPTENPFLFCALGWGSNRPNEGHYTSIKMATEQVIFISKPIRLQAFGGVNGENGPIAWGPSKLIKTDRVNVQAFRETAVDPVEAYPGNTIDSVIDVAFIGYDMLPLKPGESEDRQA